MSPSRTTGAAIRRRAVAGGTAALLVLAAAGCGSADDSVAGDLEAVTTTSSAHVWPSLATERAAAESEGSGGQSESETGGDASTDDGGEDSGSQSGSGGQESDGGEQGSDDSSSTAPFSGTTGTSRQEAGGARLLSVTDVRLGGHGSFDRVVYELGGDGVPGWWVEYVDEPTQDGSGNRIDVPGSAYLQVYLDGVGYPFDTGVAEYDGPRTVTAPDVQAVQGITMAGVYEGRHMSAIGVSEVRPYRVFRLESPPRVVIDVAR